MTAPETRAGTLDRFVGVRMPASLVKRLERFAKRERTSSSALIREAVATLVTSREGE